MLNPDEIYKLVMAAGDAWADKDAAASILEETKSIVLAELINNQPQTLGVSVRESLAKGDPVYRLHVTNMVAARKDANKARVRYKSAEMLADLRRSEESTRRSEINLR